VRYEPGLKRSGQPVLQVWTDSGSCDHEAGCYCDGRLVSYREPVTVWQIAPSPEQQERLQALKAEQGALL
jgi:hypothetical protein